MRLTAPLAAVTVHGSDAGKGCDLLFVSDTKFGEFGDQHCRCRGADAWNRLQQHSFARERGISLDFSRYARIALADVLAGRQYARGSKPAFRRHRGRTDAAFR